MPRMMVALAALVLSLTAGAAVAGQCEQRSPTVFVIKGELDPALADCVAGKLKPTTTELLIDSQGGKAGAAIDIAERLSGLSDLTIRVDGLCMSGCANYILPMGRRLVAGPRALIAVHGSIDPAAVARAPDADRERFVALADKQLAFARRHKLPPGWLMYRTAEAPKRVDGLDGAYRWWTSPDPQFFLVEGPLLRSCLPWLEIGDYQAVLAAERFTPEASARLKRNRVVATGSIVCNGQGWSASRP